MSWHVPDPCNWTTIVPQLFDSDALFPVVASSLDRAYMLSIEQPQLGYQVIKVLVSAMRLHMAKYCNYPTNSISPLAFLM
jgi:hypothetical protein